MLRSFVTESGCCGHDEFLTINCSFLENMVIHKRGWLRIDIPALQGVFHNDVSIQESLLTGDSFYE